MDQKNVTIISGITAGIFLIIAMVGILFNTSIQNIATSLDSARSLAILGLTLLSMGFFYRNHASKIDKLYGASVLHIIGWLCLIFFVLITVITYIVTNGAYTIPIFMGLLAIGLFLGNYVMNQNP